jgi:hypothetical protein
MTRESEDSSVDYGFISKYIREDSNGIAGNLFKEKFKTKEIGSTEVFNSIGQEDDYPEKGNFNRGYNNKYNQDNDSEEFEDESSDEKVKSTPGPVSEAKKEFLEHLKKKDALTVDTCISLTHDWKK